MGSGVWDVLREGLEVGDVQSVQGHTEGVAGFMPCPVLTKGGAAAAAAAGAGARQ